MIASVKQIKQAKTYGETPLYYMYSQNDFIQKVPPQNRKVAL